MSNDPDNLVSGVRAYLRAQFSHSYHQWLQVACNEATDDLRAQLRWRFARGSWDGRGQVVLPEGSRLIRNIQNDKGHSVRK